MTEIKLAKVSKSYGQVEVLRDIDLDIKTGEFVVFVGPSGCGKSTLLKMIAGLEDINDGDLLIDGVRSNDTPPAQRGIAMVFQSYALYPHMTVAKNMGFSLRIAGESKERINERVARAAEMLQLTPLLQRYPRELSGGQRQRVAIGRAIVRESGVFLFDEPLSNLDAALRVATRVEIAELKERLPDTTMIYVTHDQVEAMTLADRIVVLNGGTIEQVGPPTDLYHRPNNRFVAGFIGSPAMNMIPCDIAYGGDGAKVTVGGKVMDEGTFLSGDRAGTATGTLGWRPEHVVPAPEDEALVSGKVELIEHLGEVTIAYLGLADGSQFLAKFDGTRSFAKGEVLHLRPDRSELHLFDADGLAHTRRER
ncbi:ABC transporter ATP-binding protein [Pelagovum pacificum]|uniref:sn-glycerol-3-phosphate ABC transporter ATP-binding protein UgpC n=1 Tax=Pelagovum pacificum TaxID=2588711 RepID=A0A5C5GHD5_9RHOB|nr:sn-glycerol-3-phosphate ABC transporter ATP-binding protein UgpC [Pelagovum pacificum]QQA43561.1 sn-glycerol-3-phosphate ABC transporter ATP-binding protein UgpC [Pelagovum pacificum]TNY33301.1 sn-glycerol-3-phosphate ABC transporter ATP-binding protein UgpC [Pelagovum pacificum]